MSDKPSTTLKQTLALGVFVRPGAPPSLTTTNDELVKK